MLLLIACGNPLRQDDGAGRLLAAQLAQSLLAGGAAIRYRPVHQLTPELALDIADPKLAAVIFVDTRVARGEGDTALELTSLLAEDSPEANGHFLTPATLLYYAQVLFNAPTPPTYLLTVPGFKFDHGDEPSPACATILRHWNTSSGGRSLCQLLASALPDAGFAPNSVAAIKPLRPEPHRRSLTRST